MPNSNKLISFFSDTRSQFFPKFLWYNMLANKTTLGSHALAPLGSHVNLAGIKHEVNRSRTYFRCSRSYTCFKTYRTVHVAFAPRQT